MQWEGAVNDGGKKKKMMMMEYGHVGTQGSEGHGLGPRVLSYYIRIVNISSSLSINDTIVDHLSSSCRHPFYLTYQCLAFRSYNLQLIRRGLGEKGEKGKRKKKIKRGLIHFFSCGSPSMRISNLSL